MTDFVSKNPLEGKKVADINKKLSRTKCSICVKRFLSLFCENIIKMPTNMTQKLQLTQRTAFSKDNNNI